VKKLKKHVILIALTLTLALPLIAIQANPEWDTFGMYPWINFKITESGLHIASDPLFESTVVNTITPFDPSAVDLLKGWVTFPCATDQTTQNNALKGFEFSITAKGLPRGRYQVMAYPTLAFLPDGSGGIIVVPSDDFGGPAYSLGTLRVGGKGEGELEGFYDLAAGFYAWRITVELNGIPILETHSADAADFEVLS
jgi:hypothetical protein